VKVIRFAVIAASVALRRSASSSALVPAGSKDVLVYKTRRTTTTMSGARMGDVSLGRR
jgi:hypothetical protein